LQFESESCILEVRTFVQRSSAALWRVPEAGFGHVLARSVAAGLTAPLVTPLVTLLVALLVTLLEDLLVASLVALLQPDWQLRW
jgi:uncharacterized membrane protein